MKSFKLIFVLSAFSAFVSCGNENIPANESQKSTDSSKSENEIQPPIQIGAEDSVLSNVFTTNSWVKNVEKTDTIQKEYTYVDDYDEKWPVTVYENKNGDFNIVSILLQPSDPMRIVYFYFDENEKLCQMNISEVAKSLWRDETYQTWFMKNGNPYWYTEQRIYKDKNLKDTAYAPGDFTADEHIMFYTKEHIREIMKKNQ